MEIASQNATEEARLEDEATRQKAVEGLEAETSRLKDVERREEESC